MNGLDSIKSINSYRGFLAQQKLARATNGIVDEGPAPRRKVTKVITDQDRALLNGTRTGRR